MEQNQKNVTKQSKDIEKISIRFSGDSGDGMQLTGDRLANISALMGNDVITLADYPAEIRAPAGTVYGVSGYQLNIGSHQIYTPGDLVDVLVAMNPAALKADGGKVKAGGIIIVNSSTFTKRNLSKAEFDQDPLSDDSLAKFRVVQIEIEKLTKETLKDSPLSNKEQERCQNFYALGVICWLFNRDLSHTIKWIDEKFKKNTEVAAANKAVLKAGFDFGLNTELFANSMKIAPKQKTQNEPGIYRYISGNKALALGLVAAGVQSKKELFLGSYPITPASSILHELATLKEFPILTFQAEDEIAAIGAAIGAAYSGNLGVTTTSGPGFALKSEFLNLAVMTELPLVVIDVQRGGPSTGLPTKMEQSDLLQALWGRNGESPVVVLACATPSHCFEVAYEACRIALKYMVPVVVLSDGYLANGSEPWKVPDVESLPSIVSNEFTGNVEDFLPYERDYKTLARHWAFPGMKGMEHRIGGLEKEDKTGNVSYSPENHQKMINIRAEKINRVQQDIKKTMVHGASKGLLVLGWGSTYGAIREAVDLLILEGKEVAHCHLQHLNPLPSDLAQILKQYEQVLVPESNMGQLIIKLKSEIDAKFVPFNETRGTPMKITTIEEKIRNLLK